MPMIEIMSPLSETWDPRTVNVVGEDDRPREVKVVIDPKTGKAVQVVTVGDYDIRVQYRETGSSGGFVAGTGATTFNGDGTWTCPLTLTAGKAYDIMASLYKAGADTGEYDAVSNVNVGLTPVIAIDPGTIPGPGPAPPAAALAAGPAPAPTGTYDPRKGNLIFVQLVRFDFDRMAGG